jgi:hypothetical protein
MPIHKELKVETEKIFVADLFPNDKCDMPKERQGMKRNNKKKSKQSLKIIYDIEMLWIYSFFCV